MTILKLTARRTGEIGRITDDPLLIPRIGEHLHIDHQLWVVADIKYAIVGQTITEVTAELRSAAVAS